MKRVTPEEWAPYHRRVLYALSILGQSINGARTHSAGLEYTSLMSSFLMHNVSAARSLLTLYESSGVEWFPVTVGYLITRSLFEIDVTAHYITLQPQERARQYILFEHVLNKKAMDVCDKYRRSGNSSWREATEIEWREKWAGREQEINDKYAEVLPRFIRHGKKDQLFPSWSGKSIRQLSVDVAHEEAYDTFYSELSSFTHGDVLMANRFLRLRPTGPAWTQRANWHDVGQVFHDASSFLTCFLKLFGSEFGVWSATAVEACWDADKAEPGGQVSA